jgi:hypothetical protein
MHKFYSSQNIIMVIKGISTMWARHAARTGEWSTDKNNIWSEKRKERITWETKWKMGGSY